MPLGPRKIVGLALLLAVLGAAVALVVVGLVTASMATLVVVATTLLLANLQQVMDGRRQAARLEGLSNLVRRDIRPQLGQVRAASERTSRELAAQGSSKNAKLDKGLQRLESTVGSLEQALGRQHEAVALVRSDIEWLGDILQGHIVKGTAPAEAPPGPPRDARPRLAESAASAGGTESSGRLNRLLDLCGDTYLEIGLARGKTLQAVVATHRWGVDPKPRFSVEALPDGVHIHVGTSDSFFAILRPDVTFDLVFVDGLHHYRQAYRDLIHSLNHLTPGGAVLVDDVVPCDPVSALPDLDRSLRERKRQNLPGTPWHGDVYKLVAILRDHHPDLDYRAIVDDGNPQLVVWPQTEARDHEAVDAPTLEAYDDLSYHTVFEHGVPAWFRPVSEDEALTALRREQTQHD